MIWYALATDAYKKSSEEITNKLLKSYDGKLIDLNEFEKGLNSRVEAYQKHEYDPDDPIAFEQFTGQIHLAPPLSFINHAHIF